MAIQTPSNELLLTRMKDGVRFIPPNKHLLRENLVSIKNLLALPFNVYFLSLESRIIQLNDYAVASMGYNSLKEILNNTMLDLAHHEQGIRFLLNDKFVIKIQTMQVYEEVADVNNTHLRAISFKYPWFNDTGKVVGIFGLALATNQINFSDYFQTLRKLGFIHSYRPFNMQIPYQIGNVTLTKRQRDCVAELIRGKSNREIGKTLNLSNRTVENYLFILKSKLNVSSKAELVELILNCFN